MSDSLLTTFVKKGVIRYLIPIDKFQVRNEKNSIPDKNGFINPCTYKFTYTFITEKGSLVRFS